MARSSLDKKRKLIQSLKANLKKDGAALQSFAAAYFNDAPPTDVASERVAVLVDIVRTAFAAGATRKAGAAAISITNPPADSVSGDITRIIIVNDDMPFLVDTVTTALTELGIEIQRIFHPVLPTRRSKTGKRSSAKAAEEMRESSILLDVDRRGPTMCARIEKTLQNVLKDNRAAVRDWRAMLKQLSSCAADLKYADHGDRHEDIQETIAFIDWICADHMTLLGYRYYPVQRLERAAAQPRSRYKPLGILRDAATKVWRGPGGMVDTSPELQDFLASDEPILITKANARATVHRSVHMDYIGIKHFSADGQVVGEHRFVGLFTSSAYACPAHTIPILRKKVAAVSTRAGFDAASHTGKALTHALETFPRDELFQIDTDLLLEIALGLLSLNERPRPRIFVRPDRFERFISVLAYIPREAYTSDLREQLGGRISAAYNGSVAVFYVELRDAALTRVQYIIRTVPGAVPEVDEDALNLTVAELVKGWSAQLLDALRDVFSDADGRRLFYEIRSGFSPAYRAAFTAEEAVQDVSALRALSDDDTQERSFRLYRRADTLPHQAHLKIYRQDQIFALSDSLPSIENLGLRAIGEAAFEVQVGVGASGWVHDFLVEDATGAALDIDALSGPVTDILRGIAAGRVDDDGYNTLSVRCGLGAAPITILRALGHYAQQLGIPFTRSYVERCLVRNHTVTKLLVAFFEARFSPKVPKSKRTSRIAQCAKAILAALEHVASQDDDRILRLFYSIISATLRTNAYVSGDSPPETLAFKVRSNAVPDMPDPKPYAEIFVFGPQVEGVHLRGGPVARGGLRWTDRPEDYRTEILGLLKAQIVKNSVIVPVGAKGGFLPRRLPKGGDRDAVFEAGRAAYKVFIRQLIALTDNLVDGKVVPPAGVVRHDDHDPYLVVAADKGTATFSDTANAIALDMGFWLGDAFASGGSNGYDHKQMGITARGGWVSVQRHFREMGRNTQTDPISVVGVGDMSGDVFGNGMLLSETICLIGAFDHRNIFVDPDPDPTASFAERQRLFALPRSSWRDYDAKLLSKGGQIYDRSEKTLTLTPEIKQRFGLESDAVSPQQLMQAILRAEADLLWFGGIGTYVKAKAERHGDAGDRANDAIRIDATELRVKVVGEGANLGITQAARLEFARSGGRVNADFIDNSAGVDCSDNEVNLKIMLESAVKSGALTQKKRDSLLERLTDDVADLVLRDNYLQTQAISMAEAQAAKSLDRHAALIRRLERQGRINRALDGLPSDDVIAELQQKDLGLTRPELSSLMCHAKIALFDALLSSQVVDDPALQDELLAAFPGRLHKPYRAHILNHQLSREIIATKLANAVINRGGLTLVFELDDALNCGLDRAVAAFVIVRQAFGLRQIWRGIDAGDYRVPANIQTLMHADVAFSLRRQMLRVLQHAQASSASPITAALEQISGGVSGLLKKPEAPLIGLTLEDFKARRGMYVEQGADKKVASAIAALEAYSPALTIVNAARDIEADVVKTASAYFNLAQEIGADWLRQQLADILVEDGWERRALTEMEADLAEQQVFLVTQALAGQCHVDPAQCVRAWLDSNAEILGQTRTLIADLKSAGAPTVARLSYAIRFMRSRLMPRA